eukprot:239402-Rhodomonas_salina.3
MIRGAVHLCPSDCPPSLRPARQQRAKRRPRCQIARPDMAQHSGGGKRRGTTVDRSVPRPVAPPPLALPSRRTARTARALERGGGVSAWASAGLGHVQARAWQRYSARPAHHPGHWHAMRAEQRGLGAAARGGQQSRAEHATGPGSQLESEDRSRPDARAAATHTAARAGASSRSIRASASASAHSRTCRGAVANASADNRTRASSSLPKLLPVTTVGSGTMPPLCSCSRCRTKGERDCDRARERERKGEGGREGEREQQRDREGGRERQGPKEQASEREAPPQYTSERATQEHRQKAREREREYPRLGDWWSELAAAAAALAGGGATRGGVTGLVLMVVVVTGAGQSSHGLPHSLHPAPHRRGARREERDGGERGEERGGTRKLRVHA